MFYFGFWEDGDLQKKKLYLSMFKYILNLNFFNVYYTYYILLFQYFSRIDIVVLDMHRIWYHWVCVSLKISSCTSYYIQVTSVMDKSRDKLCYLQVLWYNVLLRLLTSLMPLQPATTSRTCLENWSHIIWRVIVL